MGCEYLRNGQATLHHIAHVKFSAIMMYARAGTILRLRGPQPPHFVRILARDPWPDRTGVGIPGNYQQCGQVSPIKFESRAAACQRVGRPPSGSSLGVPRKRLPTDYTTRDHRRRPPERVGVGRPGLADSRGHSSGAGHQTR
jgi:hypothetical protein